MDAVKASSFIAAAAAFAPVIDREHAIVHDHDEDAPRLGKLADLGNLIAACLAEAPAQSLADLAAKAVILKSQLPDGQTPDVLWEGACEQERLSWSMAEDAIRLAQQQWQADPILGAAEDYWQARAAVDAYTGVSGEMEFDKLTKAWDEASAACYRTKPTTAAGVRALLDVILSRESGCLPDEETLVALYTLRDCFGEIV